MRFKTEKRTTATNKFATGEIIDNGLFSANSCLKNASQKYEIAEYQLVVDFCQIYGSIDRNVLCRIMIEVKIPAQLAHLVRASLERKWSRF